MVMLLISVSQDVAFIKSLKYETMEDMKVPEEQIELVKKLDDETFKAWKEITFLKIVQIYPKQYVELLNDYDWSKVTQSVDNLYK